MERIAYPDQAACGSSRNANGSRLQLDIFSNGRWGAPDAARLSAFDFDQFRVGIVYPEQGILPCLLRIRRSTEAGHGAKVLLGMVPVGFGSAI